MTWKPSIKEIERLKQQGKIRGYNVGESLQKPKAKALSVPQPPAPQVVWMKWNLWYWCNEKALELKPEYQFHPKRLFRFDFCIPSIFWAAEYDGLNSAKSGHTTLTGFTKDTEKRVIANECGFTVYHYTVLNYKNVLQDLDRFVKIKNISLP